MLNKTLILVAFSFLQLLHGYAQTPSYYHYTSSDGLASSTIYDIIQDRNGFVWFATINGISRFDGKNFTTLRTNNGLNSNSTISLLEGKSGELYIASYEKGINILRNGRIENYCSEIEGKSFAVAYLMLATPEQGKQTLYAYRSWGNINVIKEEKQGELSAGSVSTSPVYVNKLERLPTGEIVALTPNGLYDFKNDKLLKRTISGLPDTAVYSLATCDDGSYFVGSRGMIYRIRDNRVIRKFTIQFSKDNNDVIALLRDKNKNLWFSVMNRGFFILPDGSDQISDVGMTMGLENTLINKFLEDNEGNMWLSTFGKGVYCLNNLYLKCFGEKDGMSNNNVYSVLKEKNGRLLIGTFNGINLFENGKFQLIKSNSSKTLTEYIHRILNIGRDIYVCGAFGENVIRTITFKGMDLHLFNGPSFCLTSGGLYLYGTGGNSLDIQRGLLTAATRSNRIYIFGSSTNINRINDIFEDSEKNIWVGTGLGVCRLSNLTASQERWKKTFFPNDPVLNGRINSIFQDDRNKVWFAGEMGIASVRLKDYVVKSYTSIGELDMSSSTSVTSDSRRRIWIGNMKGLYVLEGDSVKLLNRQSGLPSDEVYSLFYDKEKNELIAGTGNGISILDVGLFDRTIPRPVDVKLESIKAGDSVYTNFAKLVFEPDQHNVYLKFGAVSFSSPGSVKYRYKLDTGWEETDNNFLDFVSLRKGKYNLQIEAKSQNSGWGKPCNLVFEIKPRYYETIWFKLGRILFVVFISILLVRWRWKVKNKKITGELELSERINKLKHQALSAMMNPHFIFNSLNSVQYLINSRRNGEANDYIAMMAKLIRKNLDSAGEGFILLSEEITRLKLYLDLEKLRFQESFSYEFLIGNDVDCDLVMIPNMIIQPFVENTLWHGVINSGNRGLVTISFFFEDIHVDSVPYRSLVIKVTDNGIGINEARKHKREDHISRGIQIIEERLKLLSTKMKLPTPIMLEDLSNRSAISHGTEVIISLPPQLYRKVIRG